MSDYQIELLKEMAQELTTVNENLQKIMKSQERFLKLLFKVIEQNQKEQNGKLAGNV